MTVTSIAEYLKVAGELPREEVRHLLLLEKPDEWFMEPPFNSGFHNLSSAELSVDEISLLGLGHKFIPVSYGPTKTSLDKSLKQYNRRVLLRDFFAQAEAAGELRRRDPPPDPRLRTGDPHWHPLDHGTIRDEPYIPTPAVQQYLDDIGAELHRRRAMAANIRVVDNLTRGQRTALAALEQRHDVVVTEADKNLGLVLMDRADYVSMGLEMLSESHIQVTNE
eukprot:SAG11_NODE_3828_length_2199_cov_7.007619_1_plen_221_part_10